MSTLTVAEAATSLGLSAHTLRYYERAGLITAVARNASGHRRYAAADLERLRFLHCLRATGMSIRQMRAYAGLIADGDATVAARRALLEQHRAEVQVRIAELHCLLATVDAKLERYSQAELAHASTPFVNR